MLRQMLTIVIEPSASTPHDRELAEKMTDVQNLRRYQIWSALPSTVLSSRNAYTEEDVLAPLFNIGNKHYDPI